MIHRDQTNDWFEPKPPLEGDMKEIMDEMLAANLQEIKAMKDEPEEDE